MLKEHKSKPGEDLTEAAVQRCSLQYKYFLKKVESWKQPAYIFIFENSCRQKASSFTKKKFF